MLNEKKKNSKSNIVEKNTKVISFFKLFYLIKNRVYNQIFHKEMGNLKKFLCINLIFKTDNIL